MTDETVPPASDTAPAAEAAPAPPELGPAACGARLAELFPALFAGAPKPIKLRIQADIQQRAPGVFSKKSLSGFLHRHTTTNAYLVALTKAPARVDLDGAPAGEIADEHREAAVAELERRRGIHEARRAAENAARRAAEAQQRQQRDAEDEQRRERATLLRAFETTTLTRANFCALKGIAEAELDARLEQARAERAERPERPPGPPQFQRPQRPPGPARADASARPERADRPDSRQPRPPRGPRPQPKPPQR